MSGGDIRIEYLILAHKNPGQLARLVRALAYPGDSFRVHIDQRVEIEPFRKAIAALAEWSSVDWLPRERSEWAEFGIVRATLTGIRRALAADPPFDYIVLLSGQDYPIKPPSVIHARLAEHPDRSYVTCYELPVHFFVNGGLWRVQRNFFTFMGQKRSYPPDESPRSLKGRLLQFLFRLYFGGPKKLPPGLKLYGGSQWWCLSRAAAQYVSDYARRHPPVNRYFQYSFAPDEIYFQTILASSVEFRANIVHDNDLHYYEWFRPTPPYPAILTSADLPALLSSDKLFARKFDSQVDATVMDLLDEQALAPAKL